MAQTFAEENIKAMAADVGPIRSLVVEIEREISNLKAVFGDLTDDITPILGPEPINAEIVGIEKDCFGGSDIAMALQDSVNRLQNLNRKVRDTRQRVEL